MRKNALSPFVTLAAICGLGVILAGSTAPPRPTPANTYEKYDAYFRKYSGRYFGDRFDWRLFKAQGIVESNLRPDVVSSSGARGVMQMTAGTFAEARRRNKEFGEIAESGMEHCRRHLVRAAGVDLLGRGGRR